jgi:arylsulfatase A-like enzyme
MATMSILRGLLLASLVAAGCSQPRAPARPKPSRNVLLIVVDSLRRDHLGCYGSTRATSPSLDRFAAAATRFDDATSQASWTTPAMGALLTSRYPTTLGIQGTISALPDGALLLSEVLAAEGFATGAVVSHSFCSSQWNFQQGFQQFDESNVLGHDAVTSEAVTDRALDFVKEHRADPFFLWVHYFDPHFGYVAHPEWDFAVAPGYAGPVRSGMTYEELWKMRRSLAPADLDQVERLYDSEVAFTDRAIGRLLDGLKAQGVDEKTLVVITADHGEEFLDHGGLFHGKTLYGEVLHVPLLARLPGLPPGVDARAVASVDLFPTLLDALGVPAPEGIAGRSLLRRATGQDEIAAAGAPGTDDLELRPIFSELDTTKGVPLRCVTMGGLKLVRDLGSGARQLFDLTADPREQRDLAPTLDPASEIARRFRALDHRLDAWLAAVERTRLGAHPVEIDEQERRRLEALGYGDE